MDNQTRQKVIIEYLDEQNKYSMDRKEKFYSWVKTMLSISTGLVGLLITLRPNNETKESEYLFIITLILCGLSILFGAIQLLAEVNLYDNLLKHSEKQLTKFLDGKDGEILDHIGVSRFYKLTEYLYKIFLFLSLVSLIIYGISTTGIIKNAC